MKIEEKEKLKEEIKNVAYNSGTFFNIYEVSLNKVFKIIDKFESDQPKLEVPKCVFEMIKKRKEFNQSILCTLVNLDVFDEASKWVRKNDELFIKAWIAYPNIAVEKEKLYTVEIPNPHEKQLSFVLMRQPNGNVRIKTMHRSNLGLLKTDNDLHLTEQEIRKDFGWAFRWAEEVTE